MKTQRLNVLAIVIVGVALQAGICGSAFSMPEDAVGSVVALRGKATAVQGQLQARALSLKAPVFLSDTIKTGQGRIQLMFNDNTLMTLGRNTEMHIQEYLWKPGDPTSALKTRIAAGSFRVLGGAITRDAPLNFKTECPAATIGIRGSMYAGIVRNQFLYVVFQGGKGIYVANAMGRVDIDRPGYGTSVTGQGKAPEKPELFDEQALEKIEGELAAGGNPEPTDKAGTQEENQSGSSTGFDPGTDDQQTAGTTPFSQTATALNTVVTEAIMGKAAETKITQAVTENEKKVLAALKDLGFSGERTTTTPGTGLWTYKGKLKDNNNIEDDDNMTLTANWDNKRIFVLEKDPNHPGSISHGFAFGEISSIGKIFNIHVLGSDTNNNSTIKTMTGSETYGYVYGTGQEALGLTVDGYDVTVQNQSEKTAWSDTLAATIYSRAANPNSGTAVWNGFFTGVGEDMNAPSINRVALVNSASSDFKLNIDKDTGIFTGTISGTDFLGGSTQINAMTMGGNKDTSVYISDDQIASVLSGSNVISNASGSTGLKPYGNFMVSSMETQLSDNTHWGYWEMAFQEPGTGKDYHVHVPGSLWIAGVQTPETYVNSLITSNFTANYTGTALGVKFDNTSQMTTLTNGQTNLNISFAAVATTPVSGTISFDQITLPVTSSTGDVTAQGFKGTITSATASRVNGTYFGSAAQGIGGNFSATMSGSVSYQGIFAGDR